MLQKLPSGFYQSTLLSDVPHLVHAFSSRVLGDMKKDRENRKKFLNLLALQEKSVATAQQIHSNKVGVDALVLDKDSTFSAAAVFVADCVPILCVDSEAKVIAAIHAGWKGTLGKITGNTIQAMQKAGAEAENIIVSIGPHIGMCCYDVVENRAKAFLDAFGGDPKVVSTVEGKRHVDLGYANYLQLISVGVRVEHIDAPPTCTSCQVNEFFSYRKDSKETFGEMMAVIGLKS